MSTFSTTTFERMSDSLQCSVVRGFDEFDDMFERDFEDGEFE